MAVAIVTGVAVVAMGRGGEMAKFIADVRPLDADIETAADVALLRPPAAMWGYDKRATDEALNAVAQTVTDRDVEIAALRRQLEDLEAGRPGAQAPGSRPAAQAPKSHPAGRPDVPGQPASPGQIAPADPAGSGNWSAWKRSDPADDGQPGENG